MMVARRQFSQYYKLIFLAVLLETSVNGVDKQSSFIKLPFGYSLSIKDTSQTTFPVISADSVTYCSLLCLTQPYCKYFTYNTGLCQMYHVWKDVVISKKDSSQNSYVFVEDDMTWHRIYSINADSNIPVYESYQKKSRSDPYSMNGRNFYRSSLIDIWKTLPIREVKLIFHNGTYNHMTLVFNGTGSDKMNWFAMDRLLSSPWIDIEKERPDHFSITGVNEQRRFYIATSARECEENTGWMLVSEYNGNCPWERLNIEPNFIYSTKSGRTTWFKGGLGLAKSMSIYIRFN